MIGINIPNGPKFQNPRTSAYSPYLKESMSSTDKRSASALRLLSLRVFEHFVRVRTRIDMYVQDLFNRAEAVRFDLVRLAHTTNLKKLVRLAHTNYTNSTKVGQDST